MYLRAHFAEDRLLLPIVIDGTRIRVSVAGQGDGLRRRLALLADAGIGSPVIFPESPPFDFSGVALLFVAGLDMTRSTELATAARSSRVLVNVEDMPALCDFHVPAQIRRGDLLVTISTAGKSPGLARILRERLERGFGPEWEGIVDSMASARREWREQGLSPDEVSRRTRALFDTLAAGSFP